MIAKYMRPSVLNRSRTQSVCLSAYRNYAYMPQSNDIHPTSVTLHCKGTAILTETFLCVQVSQKNNVGTSFMILITTGALLAVDVLRRLRKQEPAIVRSDPVTKTI